MILLFVQLALGFGGGEVEPDLSAYELLAKKEIDPSYLQVLLENPRVQNGVYELSGDTDFYHYFDEEALEEQELPETNANPNTLGWAYLNLRMKDHYNNASYGNDNNYGTGVYLHSDPLTTSTYGRNLLKITLPKGSRVLTADLWDFGVPGCGYIGDATGSTDDECRTKAIAFFRALGVSGVIYPYRWDTLGCESQALFLVNEKGLTRASTTVYTPQMRGQNQYGVYSPSGKDKSHLLGCGTQLISVTPTLDLHSKPELTCTNPKAPDPVKTLLRDMQAIQEHAKGKTP